VQRLHKVVQKAYKVGDGTGSVCVNDSHKGGWMYRKYLMGDGGWWGTGEWSQV